jgi:Protein of unknown function (DUF3443)
MHRSRLQCLMPGAIAAAVALACVLSACGKTSPASPSAPGSASKPDPPTATIPVTMTQQSLGDGVSAVRAIVHVRVGGGASIPVMLDTGSPGLRLVPTAVGSGATPTGRVIAATFGGGETFAGPVDNARVTLGSLTTPSPIAVQVIERVVCPREDPGCNPNTYLQAAFAATGAEGIMGIDTGDKFGQRVYSPLLQMPSPYSNGFSLRLAAKGSGKLILGSPPVGPGTVTAPLSRSSNPDAFPTGILPYQRDVTMCWSAGPAKSCGITDFDIGTPSTIVSPQSLPNAPTKTESGAQIVTPGTTVAVQTPSGASVWRYTANLNYGNGLTQITSSAGPGFNSGIVPFFSHTIGWNLKSGRIVISPG